MRHATWGVIATALLPLALCAAACANPHPVPDKDQLFRVVRTADGWQIPVFHLVPGRPAPGLPPVILQHGLGANRHSLDLDEEHSLARALARAGRDVWLADGRGTGNSQAPAEDYNRDYNFDLLVSDVGLVISKVQEATGSVPVDWVGHSMGGMVILAYLARNPNPGVRSVAIVASPVDFSQLRSNLIQAFAQMRGVLSLFGRMPMRVATWAGRPLIDYDLAPLVMGQLTHNPANMSEEVFDKVLENALDDTSGGVLAQFGEWVQCGCWRSMDGYDYFANLGRIDSRLLVIAGAADRIAPVDAVRPTFEKAASKDKSFLLAGVSSGLSVDYGHGDLILGRRAGEEIFPKVIEFLAGH